MTGKRREPVLVCNFDGGSVLAKGIVRRPKDNDVKIKCWSTGYQTPATILRTAGGTFFQIRIWRHWIRWLLEHRRLKSIPCRRFFFCNENEISFLLCLFRFFVNLFISLFTFGILRNNQKETKEIANEVSHQTCERRKYQSKNWKKGEI